MKITAFLLLGCLSFSASALNDWNVDGDIPFPRPEPQEEKPIPPRPTEYQATFNEADFNRKPWLRDFEYVIVISRAVTGPNKQSLRIYKNQRLVRADEIVTELYRRTQQQLLELQILEQKQKESVVLFSTENKEIEELKKDIALRERHVAELRLYQWSDGVYKISTGRDQFERKGRTNHSQKDTWTVTP
ncbi:MAG: hypothetical protein N2578_10465, partial [Bdellovibrionaceae bacterium]|nr:hypothetical protein [Pseudobdellovibrionaceae bacterium]